MTQTTMAVLRVLLDDLGTQKYGLEISTATGLPSGTVHPILARLERVGWLASAWEDIDPRQERRPARRYYRLTAAGAVAARQGLALAHSSRARITGRLRPAPDTS